MPIRAQHHNQTDTYSSIGVVRSQPLLHFVVIRFLVLQLQKENGQDGRKAGRGGEGGQEKER